jgi:flagellar protein FlaI
MNDKFDSSEKSTVLKKLSERTGMKEGEIVDELERRMAVLDWMIENNVSDYRDVNKVINMYYNYPQRTMAMILGQA